MDVVEEPLILTKVERHYNDKTHQMSYKFEGLLSLETIQDAVGETYGYSCSELGRQIVDDIRMSLKNEE